MTTPADIAIYNADGMLHTLAEIRSLPTAPTIEFTADETVTTQHPIKQLRREWMLACAH